MTRRDDVLAALRATDGFVSAQTLYAQIRSGGTKIGLATVYRTLATLTESGQVDTIRLPDGETSYRACVSIAHHHHLICRECGAAVELDAGVVERWAAAVAREHAFTDLAHTVEIVGRCPDCQA